MTEKRIYSRPTRCDNPFRLNESYEIECFTKSKKWIKWSEHGVYTVKDVVFLYKKWIKGHFKLSVPYLPDPPALKDLKGHDLACFCVKNNQ
jgi:hypothetical protein